MPISTKPSNAAKADAGKITKTLRWLARETEFVFAAEQLNAAAALIESMQAQLAVRDAEIERLREAQRWTDTEYDTPDIGQAVLLYMPDKETDNIRAGEYMGEGDYRIGNRLYRGMEIDAWLPLPAAPEEGKQI